MKLPMPSTVSNLMARLNDIRFERSRRAIAALSLSLFVSLYTLLALNPPPGLGIALGALALCYAVAFMAVAAEWFWGRWFATGLGWSGIMVSAASLVMIGWLTPLAIYGALHVLIVLPLAGRTMAARYDLQEPWRERYKMDDLGVARLRKTVTRASAALPSFILWALGPRQPEQSLALGLVALGLTAVGLHGIVRLRTWGVVACAGAAALGLIGAETGRCSVLAMNGAGIGAAFAAAAVLPFLGPAIRFVRASA
jgi:hypothetical protein